jgi:hypothetical protein
VAESKQGRFLVDPAVSKAKLVRELRQYRRLEAEYIRRGWWLIQAEFPEIFVVFGLPQLKPPGVAFGVLLDFTNYDFWAPSARLVNPFDRQPYKPSELPTLMPRLTPQPHMGGAILPQNLVQVYGEEDEPFICVPGLREYHLHPAHTNDPWEPRRGKGEGTLYWVLDQFWQFGVKPISGFNVQLQLAITGFQQGPPPG